jgi:dTDP-4-dehydrorhamnose 3,5-epimerase-like enzyme
MTKAHSLSDPALGIQWPLENPMLSDKDGCYLCLNQIPETDLPQYK